MGHSSDDSDNHHRSRRSKKKKRRKEAERYRSDSSSSDSSRYRKSRRRRDHRSDRRHRSRSPDSPASTSRSRSRYSRSHSRERRGRSRSYDSRTGSRRSRSRESNSRTASRRSPDDRKWDDGSRVDSPASSVSELTLNEANGSDHLTPSQLAGERMRLALKAAAAADEKLRPNRVDTGQTFADRVKEIEEGDFVPAAFSSSASNPATHSGQSNSATHDGAIFGSLASTGFVLQPDRDVANVDWDTDSLIHPSLFCDVDEKMDRWMDRLAQLRRRKLEGEAF